MISLELQKQSLDYGLEKFLQEEIKKDKTIMNNFGIATLAIKNGKYKNNKLKQRLKLEATKNQFIDIFLLKFLKRKKIVINIKNKIINDYFKLDYDEIMKELDKLIEKPFIDDEVLQKYIEKNNGCPHRGKQEYFYFEKEGRDRFKYSKAGLDFYDKTGKEPWKIIRVNSKCQDFTQKHL